MACAPPTHAYCLLVNERRTTVSDEQDTREYNVVVNDEEQYSIWLTHKELPDGWQLEGTSGSKQECLDHIEQVWVDMRPLSLRQAMESAGV
jgi:MbtH protein